MFLKTFFYSWYVLRVDELLALNWGQISDKWFQVSHEILVGIVNLGQQNGKKTWMWFWLVEELKLLNRRIRKCNTKILEFDSLEQPIKIEMSVPSNVLSTHQLSRNRWHHRTHIYWHIRWYKNQTVKNTQNSNIICLKKSLKHPLEKLHKMLTK